MITRRKTRINILFLCLCMLLLNLVACSPEGVAEDSLPAHYGDYGRDEAIALATNFPERYAGSEQEKAAVSDIRSRGKSFPGKRLLVKVSLLKILS